MNPSLLLRAASLVLLTAGAAIVLEGTSVAAEPQKEDKSLQFADCVKACIHRMESAKAECAARETPTHNYDVNKCVLETDTQVVECIRACTPGTQR